MRLTSKKYNPLFQSFKKKRVKQGIFGDLYLMSQLKKLAMFTGGDDDCLGASFLGAHILLDE